MRILEIGTKKYSKVVCLDEPGPGRACHEYEILSSDAPTRIFGTIYFQNGPVEEVGVNGCHQEDLLVIVMDRLQHFQRGDFACEENELALTNIEKALSWLRDRTNKRIEKGIEGTSQL